MSAVFSKLILCFHRNFSRKKLLSERIYKLLHFFRILSEQFLTCTKNFVGAVRSGFYVSKGTFSSKKSCSQKLFIFRNMFVHWIKKLQLLSKVFSSRLSKLHPMFLLEFIVKKKLFLKNKIDFLNFFWILDEDFSLFCRQNYVALSK